MYRNIVMASGIIDLALAAKERNQPGDFSAWPERECPPND
jgi:hypothetical protein